MPYQAAGACAAVMSLHVAAAAAQNGRWSLYSQTTHTAVLNRRQVAPATCQWNNTAITVLTDAAVYVATSRSIFCAAAARQSIRHDVPWRDERCRRDASARSWRADNGDATVFGQRRRRHRTRREITVKARQVLV